MEKRKLGKCGLRKLRNTKEYLKGMSVKEMQKLLKQLKPSLTNVSKLRRRELCVMLRNLKSALFKKRKGYLRNKSNSCFIDSILVALFHTKCIWIKKQFLSTNPAIHHPPEFHDIVQGIWKALKDIYKSIRNGERTTCTNLRRLFKQYDDLSGDLMNDHVEWLHSQFDPIDVINILIRVFNIKEDVTWTVQGSDPVPRKEKILFNAPEIGNDLLQKRKRIRVSDLIPSYSIKIDQGKGKRPLLMRYNYIKAKTLYVRVQRNYNNTKKLFKPIEIAEDIKLENKSLRLVSIIVHLGQSPHHGHYIAFIKDVTTDEWWRYDDLETDYEHVGSFRKLVKYNKREVVKNCVGLLYI